MDATVSWSRFLEVGRRRGWATAAQCGVAFVVGGFSETRKTWGLSYAVERFLITHLPANPWRRRHIQARLRETPRLQLGCGGSICKGWLHQDWRKGPGVDFVLDLRRLPKYVAPQSVDAVFASHVLEHLPRHEVKELLPEFLKWLKPGGVLWLAVPDLRVLFSLATDTSTTEVERDWAHMLIATPKPGHVSAWCREDLQLLLESAGFVAVDSWLLPPGELATVPGAWNYELSGKNVSLNLRATRPAETTSHDGAA